GMLRLESIGDVFEEDEPESHMLVLGRIHVVAERIRGRPKLGFEAKQRAIIPCARCGAFSRHASSPSTTNIVNPRRPALPIDREIDQMQHRLAFLYLPRQQQRRRSTAGAEA